MAKLQLTYIYKEIISLRNPKTQNIKADHTGSDEREEVNKLK